MSVKLLVINGPNINMLGVREPEIYGYENYNFLLKMIEGEAARLGIECECFQSNHEGDIVDRIQRAYGNTDGIVINPAAYTHTSVAIADAVKQSAYRRSRCTSPTRTQERTSAAFPTSVPPASRRSKATGSTDIRKPWIYCIII